jgi:WD40 repeat protein
VRFASVAFPDQIEEPGEIKLWDAVTGQATATLKGHSYRINSVAFSSDGTRIASAGEDGIVKLWDTATGEETATLKGHKGEVNSVAFSADGARIVSAGNDAVKLWHAPRVGIR